MAPRGPGSRRPLTELVPVPTSAFAGSQPTAPHRRPPFRETRPGVFTERRRPRETRPARRGSKPASSRASSRRRHREDAFHRSERGVSGPPVGSTTLAVAGPFGTPPRAREGKAGGGRVQPAPRRRSARRALTPRSFSASRLPGTASARWSSAGPRGLCSERRADAPATVGDPRGRPSREPIRSACNVAEAAPWSDSGSFRSPPPGQPLGFSNRNRDFTRSSRAGRECGPRLESKGSFRVNSRRRASAPPLVRAH